MISKHYPDYRAYYFICIILWYIYTIGNAKSKMSKIRAGIHRIFFFNTELFRKLAAAAVCKCSAILLNSKHADFEWQHGDARSWIGTRETGWWKYCNKSKTIITSRGKRVAVTTRWRVKLRKRDTSRYCWNRVVWTKAGGKKVTVKDLGRL